MEKISTDIADICAKYPTLKVKNKTTITGILPIDKVINDEHIVDSFEIEINFEEKIPNVKEIGNRTNGYKHKYKNGNLCLETNFNQLMYLENHSYLDWIEYFVINYFCSFNYYQKYKCFPFGEREHFLGDFYGFSEYMKMDQKEAWNTLKYIVEKKYRGHNLCPCDSGRKIRNCHKDIILKFQKNEEIFNTLNELYSKTIGEIDKIEKNKQIREKYL